MELQPHQLAGLLYEFPELAHLRPILHPSDIPIFKVKVIPYELGFLIKQSDPDEVYFHVELYAAPPVRADLWSAIAWKESLTKRLRNVRTTPEDNLPAEIRSTIHKVSVELHTSYGLSPTHARECANILLTGEQFDELVEILSLTHIILDPIKKLRELIAIKAQNNEH
jgi:hypothetical protein